MTSATKIKNLVESYRGESLTRMEELFENEIRDFPYGMRTWVRPAGGDNFPDGEVLRAVSIWLNDHVTHDRYLFMSLYAVGRYKDFWDWVYFKDAADAMLFKLACW